VTKWILDPFEPRSVCGGCFTEPTSCLSSATRVFISPKRRIRLLSSVAGLSTIADTEFAEVS
jgi:hypothetical protein